MPSHRLVDALIREHHEVDSAIESFASAVGNGESDPASLTGAFHALRRHIYLEEEMLFPPIRRAGLIMPILVMVREHGELWELMDRIETNLSAIDSDSIALQAACRQLLLGLEQHNLKEEPIVYPHTATDLTVEERAVLEGFIEAGETPSGWICEALR